jgi:hypothetical protein
MNIIKPELVKLLKTALPDLLGEIRDLAKLQAWI